MVTQKLSSLHIGIRFGMGGEGRIVSELFKALPTSGVSVHGVVAGPDNVAEITHGQFTSFAPEGTGMVRRLYGARQAISTYIANDRPNVVASHFALYTLPALDLIRSFSMVSHFHGPWAAESLQEGSGTLSAAVKTRIEASVYKRARKVIVLSRAFAKLAEEQYRINPARIRIVQGCVDTERFDAAIPQREARLRLGLPLDRPLLLSVRRLVRRMGLSELLVAMKDVVIKVPEVLLLIGGVGPLREQLGSQVASFGLRNNVLFLEYVSDTELPIVYRAATINVVPTLALEGFGLVAAEALSAGVPSMVTPVGGLPEVVSELSPDLVFRSNSASDLAEGLIEALCGRLALPDSTTCRKYACGHFSSSLMAARTAAVYEDAQ